MINLAEGEKVLYEIRRHWYVLFMESFIVAVLFLVPWMIFFGLSTIERRGCDFVFLRLAMAFCDLDRFYDYLDKLLLGCVADYRR